MLVFKEAEYTYQQINSEWFANDKTRLVVKSSRIFISGDLNIEHAAGKICFCCDSCFRTTNKLARHFKSECDGIIDARIQELKYIIILFI